MAKKRFVIRNCRERYWTTSVCLFCVGNACGGWYKVSLGEGDCGIQSWEIVGQFIELMGTAATVDVAMEET